MSELTYNEALQIINESAKYQRYVAHCQKTGKTPMSEDEYNEKSAKVKKIVGGAAAIGALYGGHKILNNTEAGHDFKMRMKQKRSEAQSRKMERDIQQGQRQYEERQADKEFRKQQKYARKAVRAASSGHNFTSNLYANASNKHMNESYIPEKIRFYNLICKKYNLNEDCLQLYIENMNIINEDSDAELDYKYKQYCTKMKNSGRSNQILSKNDWIANYQIKKKKIIKGLIAATALAGAGVGTYAYIHSDRRLKDIKKRAEINKTKDEVNQSHKEHKRSEIEKRDEFNRKRRNDKKQEKRNNNEMDVQSEINQNNTYRQAGRDNLSRDSATDQEIRTNAGIFGRRKAKKTGELTNQDYNTGRNSAKKSWF